MKASRRLRLRILALPVALITAVAACSADSTERGSTTASQELPSTTREASTTSTTSEEPRPFRVGLVGNITTDNWWASLDTMDLRRNQVFLAAAKTSLFELSLPGFVLVPSMAATATPAEAIQEDETWVVEQEIEGDRKWSDGVPVTADDLVFYFETVREFRLGGDHAEILPSSVVSVSAPDSRTIRLEFATRPGLALWNGAVALAPFVPSHWWEEHTEDARQAAAVAAAGVTPEDAVNAIARAANGDEDPTNDIAEADVTESQIAEHIAEFGARAGREALYAVSGASEPSAGPLVFDRWERGAFAVTTANPTYAGIGVEKTLYTDGSMRVADPARGSDEVFGGEGAGGVVDHYLQGAFVSEIWWVEHETKQAAYEALASGEIDYVLDPSGITLGLRDELAERPDLRFASNLTEGFRYLAFNLRKAPMSDRAFRQATATVVDKESIAENRLADAVTPGYTVVHPDLMLHHNEAVERAGWRDGEPMDGGARLEAAVVILRDAGYSWAVEPGVARADDGAFVGIDPRGAGLTMPNGVAVPELTILAPGEDYDPFRAAYAEHIASAMADLGIPVTVAPTEFDAIVEMAFPPQTPDSALEWDMYVLGWGAANPVLPGISLRAFFHSDQDAVFGGGFNTPGYASAEFDALADEFDGAQTVAEAARLTKEMEGVLARDLPYVVLFRSRIIEAFNDATVFPVETIMNGHQGYPGVWPASVQIDE